MCKVIVMLTKVIYIYIEREVTMVLYLKRSRLPKADTNLIIRLLKNNLSSSPKFLNIIIENRF